MMRVNAPPSVAPARGWLGLFLQNGGGEGDREQSSETLVECGMGEVTLHDISKQFTLRIDGALWSAPGSFRLQAASYGLLA